MTSLATGNLANEIICLFKQLVFEVPAQIHSPSTV